MAIDVVLVVCRDCAMNISFFKHHNQQQHSSKQKKGEDYPESMPSKQGIEPWLCGLGKLGSNQKEDRPKHTEWMGVREREAERKAEDGEERGRERHR